MKLGELVTYISDYVVSTSGNLNIIIQQACSDSRQVRPGTLFCAMKGAKLDGHQFIQDAIARGAVALLAEHAVKTSIPCVVIQNAYHALGAVAEFMEGKPTDSLKLLAVTGTNGKTTTAFFMHEILTACHHKTGMVGTVIYDVADGSPKVADRTTPTPFELQALFAEMRKNHAEYASIEVSSHALHQRRLGSAKCAAAIFTNLTQDHLDYHGDMENYYQAKKLLFTQHLQTNAPIVLNGDDPYGARFAKELAGNNLYVYSFKGNAANVKAENLRLASHGSSFDLQFANGESWHVAIRLPGAYNAANAAGAAIAAYALGLPKETVLKALANSIGAPGRMQPIPVPGNRFAVYVDYAHTDDALRNALGCLKELPHNRLIVLFGCGGDRDRTKRPKMGAAAAKLADIVVVTSDNPRTESPDAIIQEILPGIPSGTKSLTIPDRREAIQYAIAHAQPGDIILIAGKGHEDYQEINGIKHHFNDCEEAQAAIDAL
ncbi:MAG: UDP-N-acetylmuramoyl-L-alanyl-D-glutamate--2,6-diaminopimelate ligase [Victivallales bacterium]|nr:UDP-N-acetylmuramoyl-L-alanyl-D-glutamate--2,6-diaminopimelate ligase [Victivallales bacterium]